MEGLGYKISPHSLRTAFCTILYKKTGDIEFVRRAVGHSSIETTQRYIVDDDTVLGDAYKTGDETCSNKEVQQ